MQQLRKPHLIVHLLSSHKEISNGPETPPANDEEDTNQHGNQGEGSDEEWEQVGPRNKSSVTRQADFVQTPITDIFGGHMRYKSLYHCVVTVSFFKDP